MTTTLPCAPAGATRVDAPNEDPPNDDAPSDDARPPRPSTRHTGLDALRGLAALVVVIHHLLLLSPTFNGGAMPSWLDSLMHSPLHLFIDGTAAVWVFFVLSGVVVMMPVAAWTRRQWATYLPKRLIRLWLPAAASVPIALVLWFVAFRGPVEGESHWSATHHVLDLPDAVWRSFTILGGTTSLNSPLWSLRWEIIFAILFPALAVLVLALRRAWPLTLAGCAYLTWWATAQSPFETSMQALRYLPLFVIGMVLAERAPHWQPRLRRVPTFAWVALAAAAVVLVELPSLQGRHLPAMENSTGWATASAALLVLVVLHAPRLRAWGTHPALAWLASRSFSLYLVHEPILLACSSLLHSVDPFFVAPLAIPLSLVGAELFCRLVERPAQRLAKNPAHLATALRYRRVARGTHTRRMTSTHASV